MFDANTNPVNRKVTSLFAIPAKVSLSDFSQLVDNTSF